jgi:Putative Flp pilus-assembly TadE/G-like
VNCRFGRDDGQTVLLYLVAGIAMLFVALAFFAVGQAEDKRGSTQTAADAAALAAAKSARDQVGDDFLHALLSGDLDALTKLLGSVRADGADCAAAQDYASRNGSDVISCDPVEGPPGYSVEVESVKGMGKSVVEGTENKKAHAKATAVIEPRCKVSINQPQPPDGGGKDGGKGSGGKGSGGKDGGGKGDAGAGGGSSDGGGDGGGGDQGGDGKDDGGPISFTCDQGDLDVDAGLPGFDLDLGDFFTVRLSD